MLLSDRDIKAEIGSGRVKLDPYAPELIQPSSIDVRLDRFFRVFENHRYPHIDPAVEQPDLTRLVETDGEEPFVLHPGEFVLASTYEIVSLPDDIAGRLEGKSSLGRLGLLTHSTAGWIDPGFSGHVTLELSNVATLPIKLWPGMKIGQLCLFRTSSPAEHPYGSAGLRLRATRTSAALPRLEVLSELLPHEAVSDQRIPCCYAGPQHRRNPAALVRTAERALQDQSGSRPNTACPVPAAGGHRELRVAPVETPEPASAPVKCEP